MTQLLLVRHGQSTWNAAGRWQGQADPPLSALGEAQAHAAARALGAVTAVRASDLVRARRTAEIIADQLGTGPVALDPRLRERDAGPWTGLTRNEVERAYPGWLEGHRRPDGYETDEALADRTLPALLDLPEDPLATVLVVAHGGVIRTLERLLGAEPEYLPNLGARRATRCDGAVHLGPRIDLIDHDEVEAVFSGDQVE